MEDLTEKSISAATNARSVGSAEGFVWKVMVRERPDSIRAEDWEEMEEIAFSLIRTTHSSIVQIQEKTAKLAQLYSIF